MISKTTQKQLQEIQSSPAWQAVEEFSAEYIKKLRPESIRKSTEFDTIWEAAFAEGGIYYLTEFFKAIEIEAFKYNDQ